MKMANPSVEKNITKIGFLDGLRGFAALWVVMTHILVYNGTDIPILSAGNVAVDVFMMISGFLMTYHYMERRAVEPWEKPLTWFSFWVRRFFRIAPVYYVVLFIKMMVSADYSAWHETIGGFFQPVATDYTRYSDHSFQNIFMHLSFLFGMHPFYSSRSPGMPDWSISLEMQFYFVLPFLALLSTIRGGLYALSIILVGICWAAWIPFSDYLSAFFLPSFLGLKIHMFLIGMILADGAIKKNHNMLLQLVWILVLATAPLETSILQRAALIRYAVVVMLFLLVNWQRLPEWLIVKRIVAVADKFLSHRFCVFMADMSYSVYLLHHFFILPITILLLQHFGHEPNSGLIRSALCFVAVVPLSYLSAFIMHKTIEVHGIKLGRMIVAKLKRSA